MQIPERNFVVHISGGVRWKVGNFCGERERVEVGVKSACERTKGEFKFLKGNVIEKQLIFVFRKWYTGCK